MEAGSIARIASLWMRPWNLQPATAQVTRNTMADASGITLPRSAPILHFSRRQDVVAWAPMPLPAA
jgi:hypothetical protein